MTDKTTEIFELLRDQTERGVRKWWLTKRPGVFRHILRQSPGHPYPTLFVDIAPSLELVFYESVTTPAGFRLSSTTLHEDWYATLVISSPNELAYRLYCAARDSVNQCEPKLDSLLSALGPVEKEEAVTVYIIDNGEAESDHAIYFIQTDWSLDRMLSLLANATLRQFTIVGSAERVEWRDPGAVIALERWIELHWLVTPDLKANGDVLDLAPLAFWERVLSGEGNEPLAHAVERYGAIAYAEIMWCRRVVRDYFGRTNG